MQGEITFGKLWDHFRTNGFNLWDDLANFIVRPPRAQYPMAALGPPIFRILAANAPGGAPHPTAFQRHDLTLQNMRGMTLQCSWYRPYRSRSDTAPPEQPRPVCVYLHGNSGRGSTARRSSSCSSAASASSRTTRRGAG